MAFDLDHSKTYKDLSIKNIVHKQRLNRILEILKEQQRNRPFSQMSYADVGCSNGYLTNLIGQNFGFERIAGFDFEATFVERASRKYPHISFARLDLTAENVETDQFDLVTCFETLEHVGNLEAAIDNLLGLVKRPKGLLFITAPVEIKAWGIAKYAIKVGLYKYKLDELDNANLFNYSLALLKGDRMSMFRPAGRTDWGTHFGFDYRDVEDLLDSRLVNFTAFTKFATRFYLIRP